MNEHKSLQWKSIYHQHRCSHDVSCICRMDDELFGSDSDEQDVTLSSEERERNNGVLAFHSGTEEAMFIYINKRMQTLENDSEDSVSRILSFCDEFCTKRHWMMHVGPSKANILKDAFNFLPASLTSSAINVLEIGSYCGYSTALIANLLAERDKSRSGEGNGICNDRSEAISKSHLVSIEPDPKCVKWTNRMLSTSFCNLSSYSTVLQTTVSVIMKDGEMDPKINSDFLTQLSLLQWDKKGEGENIKFDLVFIDHDKSKYLCDLKLLQQSSLLKEKCVIVADNVLSFGQPLTNYLEYVRCDESFASSELFVSELEYSSDQALHDPRGKEYFIDGVEVSVLV